MNARVAEDTASRRGHGEPPRTRRAAADPEDRHRVDAYRGHLCMKARTKIEDVIAPFPAGATRPRRGRATGPTTSRISVQTMSRSPQQPRGWRGFGSRATSAAEGSGGGDGAGDGPPAESRRLADLGAQLRSGPYSPGQRSPTASSTTCSGSPSKPATPMSSSTWGQWIPVPRSSIR